MENSIRYLVHNEKDMEIVVNDLISVHMGRYKNKKHNTFYYVTGVCINATNAQNGQVMVTYMNYDSEGNSRSYVREIHEFLEKFERING